MSNFKVGDLCDFLGMAVVIKAIDFSSHYPIKIESTVNSDVDFHLTVEGRALNRGEIVLKLIERSKKKITKRFWIFDIKNNSGHIFKTNYYMDEQGKGQDKLFVYDSNFKLLKKHENEFIDIEVEE